MFRAPFTSASIAPCKGQMTTLCCGRAHRLPQRWQPTLVPAGFTSTTRRPASAALPVRMVVNWAHPASRMLLFSPAFAAARFGRKAPAFPRSGLGTGRLVIPAGCRSSSAITSHSLTSARAVLWWKSRRRLRALRHSLASARLIRLRFPDVGRALLGPCQVGTELIGSSHRRPVPVFGEGNGPAGCRLAGPRARRSYGLVPTIPDRHTEGRERGFTSSRNAGVPAAHL